MGSIQRRGVQRPTSCGFLRCEQLRLEYMVDRYASRPTDVDETVEGFAF